MKLPKTHRHAVYARKARTSVGPWALIMYLPLLKLKQQIVRLKKELRKLILFAKSLRNTFGIGWKNMEALPRNNRVFQALVATGIVLSLLRMRNAVKVLLKRLATRIIKDPLTAEHARRIGT